jgi:hypothetical protein
LLRLVTRAIPKLVSKIEDQYSDRQTENEDMHLTLLPPIVSPSIATYYDTIEDISDDEIDFIIQKILNSTNSDALLYAWSDLEIFRRSKRAWRHEGVWEALSKEIFAFDKSDQYVVA